MQEGSLRCDVNLSVRKKGETTLGVRTEMKNLNSFTNIHKAIRAEYRRQVDELESGRPIRRETRRFDPSTGQTTLLRTKEKESDYRFLSEPDLPPFRLPADLVESLRKDLPVLPAQRIETYETSYGLSRYDSELLTASPALAAYFESCASHTVYPKQLANLFIGELFRLLPADITVADLIAIPAHLGYVATLLGEGKVNSTTAKKLLLAVWQDHADPMELMQKENLSRIDDASALTAVVEAVLRKNPSMVGSYLGGKQTALKALMGACMAATKGKADPVLLRRLLTESLSKLS
jgi:aspartyl-tRNA(Asn)/glutamyl-tRNA(Gln) amidotransferase subunit B